jgi:O-methyltransferase
MTEAAHLNSQGEAELEKALSIICKNAGDEAIAGRIFDRVLTDLVRPHHRSMFWGDRLLTIDKSAGFKNEPGFKELLAQVDPNKGCNQYASPDRLSWRLHTMIWAASCAFKVPGDFIECGVTHGDMPWVITEALDFESTGKSFYAYDTFEGFDFRYSSELDFPEVPHFFHALHAESRQDPHRHEKVAQRFSAKPYVKIIRGVVPDILGEVAPEKVAFLHLDMNAPFAQKGALEFLFDRLSHGAIVIFDDYGWLLYHREKEVADEFFGARGHRVLELPTGQGLVMINKYFETGARGTSRAGFIGGILRRIGILD